MITRVEQNMVNIFIKSIIILMSLSFAINIICNKLQLIQLILFDLAISSIIFANIYIWSKLVGLLHAICGNVTEFA